MSRLRKHTMIAILLATCVGIVACSTVTITTTSLPNGVVGQAYTAQLQGTYVTSWSLIGGGLPSGLTLSSTGVISGTPASSGTFSFTVQAFQDTSGTSPTISQAFTITVTSS